MVGFQYSIFPIFFNIIFFSFDEDVLYLKTLINVEFIKLIKSVRNIIFLAYKEWKIINQLKCNKIQ